MIHDRIELQKFIDILDPVQDGEAYFLCLATRNKYLTEEAKTTLGIRVDKMFSHEIVTRLDRFTWHLEKSMLALSLPTKEGKMLPPDASVIYTCINPRGLLKAFIEFQTDILKSFTQQSLTKNPQFQYLNKIVPNLYSAIQRSCSRKIWLDIDCDVDSPDRIKPLLDQLDHYGITRCVIKTRGGYHVLVKRSSLKGAGFMLDKFLHDLHDKLEFGEIKINSNEMVPTPGTIQGSFPVHILDNV